MTIFLRFLPYLITAGLLITAWLWADRACWSSACKSERSQVEKLRSQIENAVKHARDIEISYAQKVKEANDAASKERSARVQQASEFARRARNLDRSPTLAVGPDASSLLRDATGHANSAAAPIGDKAPAVAVPGVSFSEAELVAAWAEAAIAYADANSLRLACVNFYENLRSNSLPQ